MKSEKEVKFGKRKALLFAVIFTTLAFVSVGCTSADTIYVPIDYPTIQQAIDVASPNDTVFVYNGTYYENVSILEDRITLQGEDANTTTIHGRWVAEEVVYVDGNYVNVSGFTVTGSNSYGYGIYVRRSSNCLISDNIVDSNYRGIYLYYYSDNNAIINNDINSNDYGIRLYSSSNNIIANNVANSNNYGIYLGYSSNNNTIAYNIANSNWNGIHLYSSSNNSLITGNTADVNKYGIYLKSTSTNNIIENNISNNTDYGIYLDYTADNEIYHNNFINNDKQAYDYHGFNEWDKGPIIGGNHWSDHVCHGNPSNGTEPYTEIDTNAGAVDNYPFEDPNGWIKVENVFDTEPSENPYPSIMGTHNGTITPSYNINVSKLYTYPCVGTGGHTESIELYDKNDTLIANGSWNGYIGDYHNITIHNLTGVAPYVTLLKNHEYRYVIKTGSYPQILHEPSKNVTGGTITCNQFIDANGKIYTGWIPAIRLWAE